ncbi:LytR/AlgR family response regulator transcription factor [Butyrivibrio sp. MC2013]|uniref:LytR/AlgR family response regulator transcription factor n=1 Tax=Butyrivibrio sp. MC2013 TaxID=1280686 RepID=UPI000401031B|nr:LytTR family DNA-binding domain-containing protein [Butyrivibrio sp. MC2013]
MLRVAVCDDEIVTLKQITHLLQTFARENKRISFDIESFQDSATLLSSIKKKHFDIYLLDIFIDELSGVEIARQIRADGSKSEIIFLTASEDYYRDAYKLKVSRYIAKPIEPEEFFEALSIICQRFEDDSFLIQDGKCAVRIPLRDILYCESAEHYKKIVTRNEEFVVRSTMQELISRLAADFFYPLGKRILINVLHVKSVTSEHVTMDNGQIFSLPRGEMRRLCELVQKYTI